MTYVQGVYDFLICLEQGRSIYSASGFIEPVATSLQNNVHPLSSSPRASQGGLERLLLFSPISLGKFGRRGVSWGDLVNGWGMLWGSLGAWGTWGMLGNALGRLGDG